MAGAECDPSLLKAARDADRSTAALVVRSSPGPAHAEVADLHVTGDSGDAIASVATAVLDDPPDLVYVHLGPSDRGVVRRVIDAARPDHAIVITSAGPVPMTDDAFFVVRAEGVAAGSLWPEASVADFAPTVARLVGFEPPDEWQGRCLVGLEVSAVDHLLQLVASMQQHDYGERVNMLEHSLQTAATLRAEGQSHELVVAGLLHDVGHLLGDAGRWGLPDHAAVGARLLQQLLPRSVVEPIRLHVEAKRHLVATDPRYLASLSDASRESLAEQGGPLAPAENDSFADETWSAQAIALRRADDAGKTPGVVTEPLSSYRRLVGELLADPEPSARGLRDRCACVDCRDQVSGQHLVDPATLDGWRVLGRHDDFIELVHRDGDIHRVVDAPLTSAEEPPALWYASRKAQMTRHDALTDELGPFAVDLSRWGIALAIGLPPAPGEVLGFASRLGHVRATNYGDLFDVKTVPNPNNLAYTSQALPLHTDNPYREPVPTVQVLHCLRPAEAGGLSRFSDGFAAAGELRAADAEAFDVLASTPIEFRFAGPDIDLRATRSMISVRVDGSVNGVYVNHRSMVAPEKGGVTDAFYDAYGKFARIIESAEHVTEIRLEAGDVIAFDNRRVLHARTGFVSTSTRHLQGCYIDIDAINSTARLARR